CDFFAKKAKLGDSAKVAFFYDGECGFCKRMVLILREFLLLTDAKIAPSQSDPEAAKILKSQNSWAFLDAEGTYHPQASGIIALLEASPLTGMLARRLPLRDGLALGDYFYQKVAKNRSTLGKIASRFFPLRDLPPVKPRLL